jgi:hypothetical protein
MSTFIDNVAILAIENCLLLPLESIFTSLAVNNMSDERIKFYGSEAPFIQADRERLRGELDKLQAGLRACSRYNRAALGVRHALKPGTPVERKSSTESRVTVKLPTETARSSIPAQGGTANAVGANGIPSFNIEAQKPRRAKHAKEFSDSKLRARGPPTRYPHVQTPELTSSHSCLCRSTGLEQCRAKEPCFGCCSLVRQIIDVDEY